MMAEFVFPQSSPAAAANKSSLVCLGSGQMTPKVLLVLEVFRRIAGPARVTPYTAARMLLLDMVPSDNERLE
jgi:hypothetical protein